MTYKFEFTKEELNLVVAGLGELPAKASMQFLNKLVTEAQKQEVIEQKPEEKKPESK